MKNTWKVDFYDNDDENVQVASFESQADAQRWIDTMEESQHQEPTGFEVVDGPYCVTNLWFDAIRPAPEGYVWLKSIKDFTDDYAVEVNRKFDDLYIVSLDTKNDIDGYSFKDVLSYFINNNIKHFKLNVHGNDIEKKNDLIDYAIENDIKTTDSLDEDDESKDNALSFSSLKKFAESINAQDAAQGIVDAMIVFISSAFDVDAQKFADENEWLINKLQSFVATMQTKINFAVPLVAVKYPSTNVSMLYVADLPTFKDKSFKGIMNTMKKAFDNVIRPGSNTMLLPFKVEDGKILHDTSENAYMQLAMTYLLSDIEFDMLWPVKANIQPLMKYLDYICPSLMDVIGLATFGGASIGARAAKISAKAGAKGAVKTVSKKGTKKIAQKQLKFIEKLSQRFPEVQKKMKKAKEMSSLSRKMKNNLKSGNDSSQKLDEDLSINNVYDGVKIWVDDIRPAPEGYIWIKSTNDFIDYMVEHGTKDILVLDFDHDAGEFAKDGGDYIKCLDWLEQVGADNINVRLHSSNPAGIQNMRRVIKKNQWNEVYDIYCNDDLVVDEQHADVEKSTDEQKLDEMEIVDEQEDSAKKRKIVDAIKKASKDFQDNAANNDPEQFAKIVVAFDDLAAAVGAYDFKEKKVLKEMDSQEDSSLSDFASQLDLDSVAKAMKDAGVDDVTVEYVPGKDTSVGISISPSIAMHGSFVDNIPLDSLNFHWHDADENADAGWYEGTRCINKWRGIGKSILDKMLPSGWPKQEI